MPKQLHHEISICANADHISLNQWLVYAIAQKIAKRQASTPSKNTPNKTIKAHR
ncbi:MAG: toxin-antitoxin system HicB family antitoxin [Limnohabitans sp.]|nr:toxin-antitoxin system HicB family antitoxin [Limnohabitans sp.]